MKDGLLLLAEVSGRDPCFHDTNVHEHMPSAQGTERRRSSRRDDGVRHGWLRQTSGAVSFTRPRRCRLLSPAPSLFSGATWLQLFSVETALRNARLQHAEWSWHRGTHGHWAGSLWELSCFGWCEVLFLPFVWDFHQSALWRTFPLMQISNTSFISYWQRFSVALSSLVQNSALNVEPVHTEVWEGFVCVVCKVYSLSCSHGWMFRLKHWTLMKCPLYGDDMWLLERQTALCKIFTLSTTHQSRKKEERVLDMTAFLF